MGRGRNTNARRRLVLSVDRRMSKSRKMRRDAVSFSFVVGGSNYGASNKGRGTGRQEKIKKKKQKGSMKL